MAINRFLTASGGGGLKLFPKGETKRAQQEIKESKKIRSRKDPSGDQRKSSRTKAEENSGAGTAAPAQREGGSHPETGSKPILTTWAEIPYSETGTPLAPAWAALYPEGAPENSGSQRAGQPVNIPKGEWEQNDPDRGIRRDRSTDPSVSLDTYAHNRSDLQKNVLKMIGNYAAGFKTGDGRAADFYTDEVKNARQAGADLRMFIEHPLETVDTWFSGEAAGFGPDYPTDGFFNRVAERSRQSLPMNVYRSVVNEDLAAASETGRLLSDVIREIPGVRLDGASAFFDGAADAARRDAADSRERIFEGDSWIHRKLEDRLIRFGHSNAGVLLQYSTDIPAQLPLLIRQFSSGVQKAQDAGEPTLKQLSQGLRRVGSAYVLNTMLKGFRLTEADKQTVNLALTEMSTDPLLLAAAEQAEGDEIFPVLHTAVESLVPVVGDVIHSTYELQPTEIQEIVHGYLAETIADYAAQIESNGIHNSEEPADHVPERTNLFEDAADGGEKTEEDSGQLYENEYNEKQNTKPFVSNPFDEKGALLPNVAYVTGEYDYYYETDDLGRIECVTVETLQETKRDKRISRWAHNPPGKQPGVDHAGHIIADRFGGSNKLDNIVSQLSKLNQSKYRQIENNWLKHIRSGDKVSVHIKISYNGQDWRPGLFQITTIINGTDSNTQLLFN